MSDVVTEADLKSWVEGLDSLFARVAGRFGRVEPRRQARAYLTGLLAPVERKNGWQLAEAAGDATPDRMQRLLNNACWDPDTVRDDLRSYVAEHLGHRDGVLIVDLCRAWNYADPAPAGGSAIVAGVGSARW